MPRFVQFDEFGSRDYLHVVERERPWPGPGQLLVRVMAAGLNPMDCKAYRDEARTARGGGRREAHERENAVRRHAGSAGNE